jgi:hypothetical protein
MALDSLERLLKQASGRREMILVIMLHMRENFERKRKLEAELHDIA